MTHTLRRLWILLLAPIEILGLAVWGAFDGVEQALQNISREWREER